MSIYIPFIFCVGALTIAALSDIYIRIIPDSAAAIVLISGTFTIFCFGETWMALLSPVAIAAILFFTGLAGFGLGVVGGGDVKLMSAFGLWLTPATVGPFLVIMAVAGGLLALGMAVVSALRHRACTEAAPTVPYGVAIAVSGLFILFGAQ